ncbi:hypothetical protein J437_LFUL000171 [Ladona fulva]|uniref:RGS domain-containing protein n=1 Tax=Ladona fulva TaxID=123851 RepID=A0A8K0P0R4_LADFU|nr:hypothetical protein J437_LFUL000171 [Ladona fulva]
MDLLQGWWHVQMMKPFTEIRLAPPFQVKKMSHGVWGLSQLKLEKDMSLPQRTGLQNVASPPLELLVHHVIHHATLHLHFYPSIAWLLMLPPILMHSGHRSSSSNSLPDSSGTPPYLRWARNLRSLLEDPDGVELFRRYLEGEQCADTLNFWFACEGLKKQPNDDPGRIAQLIKVIHRKFFPRAVMAVPEEMRREVARRVRESTTSSSTTPATSATSPLTPPDAPNVSSPATLQNNRPDCHVFDSVQREVERHINETTYPNFLRSELYLNHVQCMQSGVGSGVPGVPAPGGGSGSSSGSSCGGGEEAAISSSVATGPLPTVHEDSELVVTGIDSVQCSSTGGAPASQLDPLLPLTRDMLLVTQNSRALELRPKPEAYAGYVLPFEMPVFPHLFA